MELSDCLDTYAFLLGPNCENLGKTVGSCLLTRQKIMLSWTALYTTKNELRKKTR